MFKALCAEVVPLLPPKLNSRGIDPTIKNGELRNFRKHFENLCSTHERAALLGSPKGQNYTKTAELRRPTLLLCLLKLGKIWPRPARAAADAPRCRPRAALQEGGCRRAALPATIDTLSELWARPTKTENAEFFSLSDGYGVSVELRVREKAPPAESTSDSTVGQSSAGEACERRGRGRRAATTVSPHQALEVSTGRAAAAPRARDGAGRVLGSRAEPLTGKALPKTDAAPAAPAGPATSDALQRAREDRDRLIHDLKRLLNYFFYSQISICICMQKKNATELHNMIQPIDGGDKRATCLACQKDCSYKTTIANLKTHLRLMHNELYEQMLGGDETEYYLEQDEVFCHDTAE
ncbi:hypothetical protein MSG28_012523 [Choristoneura fumiferana]|uniref:Uncharacterized protein n=1 Tax=Choristoneura fumiferana TaxID=7141 RepID=A0ACC0KEI8_CHOFU|nr:hypothetical protein MSG28_012523 [Choristoneura fumiferana]